MRFLKTIMNVSVLFMFIYAGFLMGCSTAELGDDKAFESYKTSFIKTMKLDVKKEDYVISFASFISDNEDAIGICNYVTEEVRIDPTYWYNSLTTYGKKKALIYHELTHCICKIRHDNKVMPDNCPISIMNENIPSNKCLNKHWKRYIEDLKGKCE